jgi:hypothetical protein
MACLFTTHPVRKQTCAQVLKSVKAVLSVPIYIFLVLSAIHIAVFDVILMYKCEELARSFIATREAIVHNIQNGLLPRR